MLVLSRMRDQKVVITVPPSAEPTHVEVTLVDIRGDKVRLGFDAPDGVVVDREEVAVAKRYAAPRIARR